MEIKPPSPKVSAFLIIVVVLTTISIIAPKFFPNNPKEENIDTVDLTIKNSLEQNIENTDSDKDGLPDWQEEIWGTDKNNPDTDGDKTKDGEEVEQNRNPLSANKDDKIIDSDSFIDSYVPNETDPNSLTSILSKNLLIQYASQSKDGTFGQTNLAEDFVNQAYSQIQIPDKYSENIFLTFDGSNKEKLTEYGVKFIEIQLVEAEKIPFDNKDPQILIQGYKNIAYNLSTIAVPDDLLSVHAKVTNNFYIISEILSNFAKSDQDPILGLLTIPIYKKVSEEQPILLKQIENYLSDNDIILTN